MYGMWGKWSERASAKNMVNNSGRRILISFVFWTQMKSELCDGDGLPGYKTKPKAAKQKLLPGRGEREKEREWPWLACLCSRDEWSQVCLMPSPRSLHRTKKNKSLAPNSSSFSFFIRIALRNIHVTFNGFYFDRAQQTVKYCGAGNCYNPRCCEKFAGQRS